MAFSGKSFVVLAIIAGSVVLIDSAACMAQVQRYQPSTPTVSPYLNLFQNNRNGRGFNSALPNYYSLVRPQLNQIRTNQFQQQLNQQQAQVIGQLQSDLQRPQAAPTAVSTGHSSWFGDPRQPQSQFLNTSRYFERAGTGGRARR